MDRSEDPYDRLLTQQQGIHRQGDGYVGMMDSGREGFSRLASNPYKSRSGILGGLFQKKDPAPSRSGFKGLVHSMKTAFGRH
jgi:hypothetical protein